MKRLLPLLLLLPLAVAADRWPDFPGPRALYVNVKDFGAKGDGVADDTAEIQAALDANTLAMATASGDGAIVFVPAGIYMISNTINVPNGVILKGAGAGPSAITATAAFPLTGTPMITLVDEATGPCSKTRIEDMMIDANSRAELAISTDCINEGAGLRHITIRRLVEDGILIDNANQPANYTIDNITATYVGSPTATSVGFDAEGPPQVFNAVTINGTGSPNAASIAIRFDAGVAMNDLMTTNVHMEDWGNGMVIDDTRNAVVTHTSCAGDVTNCLTISANDAGLKVISLFHDHVDGAGNTLVDSAASVTLTDRRVSQYFIGDGATFAAKPIALQASSANNNKPQATTTTGIVCAAATVGSFFYDTDAGAAGTADDGLFCVCNDDAAQGYIWRQPSTPTTELTNASTTNCGD